MVTAHARGARWGVIALGALACGPLEEGAAGNGTAEQHAGRGATTARASGGEAFARGRVSASNVGSASNAGSAGSVGSAGSAGSGRSVGGASRVEGVGRRGDTVVVHLAEASERDAGMETRATVEGPLVWSADAGPAVSADAGTRAAELAWLVTRIADGIENAGPAGPANVRALASYGGEGVMALVSLFAAGDARRVPAARRVIERVAVQGCRAQSDPRAPRRVVAWLETGVAELPPTPAGGHALSWPWARGPEFPWLPSALERLRGWARRGAPCIPRGTGAVEDPDDDR